MGSKIGVEIEKKWLVCNDSWLHEGIVVRIRELCQAYVITNPFLTSHEVRAQTATMLHPRIEPYRLGAIAVKTTGTLIRKEWEWDVEYCEVKTLIESLVTTYAPITKLRVDVKYQGKLYEIDVYEGNLEGLVICELELENADESFAEPPWVDYDVTKRPQFYNSNLFVRGLPSDFNSHNVVQFEQRLGMARSWRTRLRRWK